nr:hypothetical protein [uncultured Arsenicibacter sp.]
MDVSEIEKRPFVYALLHSKEAVDNFLLSDDVVPDRVGALLQQYPFLREKLSKEDPNGFTYDNAPYYENARWLILTMAEMITELQKRIDPNGNPY